MPNAGYYIPTYRPYFNSHTLLQMDSSATAIKDKGIELVRIFLENIADPGSPLARPVLRPPVRLQALRGAVADHFSAGPVLPVTPCQ